MIKESYRQIGDEELVRATLEGDKRAYGEIVSRYQNMVARTVKGMLGDFKAGVFALELEGDIAGSGEEKRFVEFVFSCVKE